MNTSSDIKTRIVFEWLTEHAPGFTEFATKRDIEIRFPEGRAEDRPTRTLITFSGKPVGSSLEHGASMASVLKMADGTYRTIVGLTPADEQSAVAVYRGGYQNEVTEEEAAALEAAGFRVKRKTVPA